jgi:hypothetical protein
VKDDRDICHIAHASLPIRVETNITPASAAATESDAERILARGDQPDSMQE